MHWRVAVLDDFFPHKLSAFRFEEFHTYLETFPDLSVHATWPHLRYFGEQRSAAEVFAEYAREHPALAPRVKPLFDGTFPSADAYYGLFLKLIWDRLPAIEAQERPFAFTLYPGGGFRLNEPDSDAYLARVCGSPCFRRVIATQPVIRDYLLDRGFCDPAQILYIPGGVIHRSAFDPPPPKIRYGLGKSPLDLAFVAAKYTPNGADKGYDLFVETAQLLFALGIEARFHVVGGFDAEAIELGPAAPHFRFYGYRPREFFRDFYARIDLIVAPTRPFVMRGGFDGFPTASCVEAGLQSVALALTDELGLNTIFRDGEDAVILRPDRDDIAGRILRLAQDPTRLATIGEAGRIALIGAFGRDVQIAPRLELLRGLPEA